MLSLKSLPNRVRNLSACLLALAVCVLCARVPATANPPCPSDLDGSGTVDFSDVALVMLDFGPCPVDPPSISAVSPTSGLTSGGTTITITGTALTGTSSVMVRGTAATSVVVVNDTTVIAVTPPGSAGKANVRVTTPGGAAMLSDAFTYLSPPPPPSWCTVLEQTPNATVVPDATLRAAMTATGLPWRVRDTGSGIEMVLIPPGTFTMGCSASNTYGCSGNETQHQVTLTQAFYMSRTEVTQAQWVAKMGSNPSYFTGDTSRPVEQVTWNDIQLFCTATGMRLPTEAEWEYAYRAGTTTAFHGRPGFMIGTNDDGQLDAIAWFFGAAGGSATHAVAGKAANGFGLYDMSGNVWEWCQDWYGAYASGAQTNPTGPSSGGSRVLRGGSWLNDSSYCRASYRTPYPPFNGGQVGFRVARTP